MRGGGGRKSTASMSVAPVVDNSGLHSRPAPPEHLSQLEADQWRVYVDRMPLGWFGPETFPLLSDLCRSVVLSMWFSERLAELQEGSIDLEATIRDDDPDIKPSALAKRIDSHYNRISEFSKLQLDHAKHAANLSTKLRLTPQSRYNPIEASTKLKATPTRRPWESRTAHDAA